MEQRPRRRPIRNPQFRRSGLIGPLLQYGPKWTRWTASSRKPQFALRFVACSVSLLLTLAPNIPLPMFCRTLPFLTIGFLATTALAASPEVVNLKTLQA